MKQNQKAIAYAVGVIVVLALVVWLAGKPTPAPMPTTSPSASVSTTATPVKTLVPPSTPTGAMPKSYGDAVTAYANARIQFENGCVANLTASRVSTEKVRKLRFFQPREYVSIDFSRQDVVTVRVEPGGAGERPVTVPRKIEPPRMEPLKEEIKSFLEKE